MARKKKDNNLDSWNKSLGYSKESLDALSSGNYDQWSGDRNSKYRTSQEQTVQSKELPTLKGLSAPKSEWSSRLSNARQYQQNLEADANNYKFNNATRKANTLDADDMKFLQKYFDEYGDSARTKKALYESNRTKGWEQKYGKSYDEIYKDFLADQGNVNLEKGFTNPIKSEIETAFGVIPQIGASAASFIGNMINPDSKFAKGAEELRHENEVVRKQKREGVKASGKAKVDTVNKIIGQPESLKGVTEKAKSIISSGADTAHGLSDRMLPTALAKATKVPFLDAVASGLSDYNTQMEEVRLRPGMDGRDQAKTAGAHAAVEGLGTAITMGLLDKIPGASGMLGKAINIAKGAGNGAAENYISEFLEQKLDNAVSGDLSKEELNKGMYMLQGMTPEQADEQVAKDNRNQRLMALGTGALFGGGMKTLSEIGSAIKGVPTLEADAPKTEIEEPKAYDGAKYSDQIPENWTVEDLENATKDIPETSAKAETTGLPQKRMPATERYSIQTVYAQDGSPRYFVRENTSDTGSRPVEPGKVYKTEAEAQKVIDNLNNQIPEEPNAQTNNSGNLQERLNSLEDKTRYKAALTEQKNAIKRDKSNYEDGKLTPEAQNRIAQIDEQIKKTQDEISALKGQKLAETPTGIQIEPENSKIFDMPIEDGTTDIDPDNPATTLSRRYETLKKSPLFTQSEANMKLLENAKEEGVFDKGVEGRIQAQNQALKEFVENPEKAITDLADKKEWSGKDMDMSMLILQDALDNSDPAQTNLTLLNQVRHAKSAGRQLRALRDYSYAGTKEGTLSKATDYLLDQADKILGSKKNSEKIKSMAESVFKGDFAILKGMDEANVKNIRDAIDNGADLDDIVTMLAMHEAVGKTGISPETINRVTELYKEIEKLPPTSKAKADAEADVFKILAQDIGGKRTAREMWDSWRYLAMLGNPKTHLRNILGNTTHRMVTEVKDNIGAIMEEAIDKANRAGGGEGIERTKAILGAGDKGLVDASAKDADDVAYAALNDMKQKYNVKDEIGRAVDSFNNKTLSKIDDFNSALLEKEDYSALKKKYSKSLARFLKANGADESIFSATDDASKELLDKARSYAINQAKQATFHEYSLMADKLTQFSKGLQESGKARHKAASWVLEGLVPFKKTPINILKQGAKYSPISLAKGLGKVFDAVKTGNSTASDAIEDFASGLTGTGIMALGAFLANQGILTGAANENYDVDQAETEQGKQNYALQIGDKSYTLDWLAPMSLPLFVGAELMNLFNEDGGDDEGALDKVIQAVSTIAEPVTEMSMLQGIQNVLNELSYSAENAIAAFGANTALGYISQGIPTLAGQFARAIDDTRRSTYSDQPQGFKRQFDKAITKDLNKLPFLSMGNEAYVDARGQNQQNEGLATHFLGNNFGTRLIDQMASPGYFKAGNVSDVDRELNRLYEKTGENVYLNVASGKIGNNPQKLSKEKFTEYQTLYGGNNDALYNAIINSPEYNAMDDAERTKLIKGIKDYSKLIADHEVGGKELDKSDQNKYDIYKTKGIDGVIQYFKDDAKAKALGLTYSDYIKKEQSYNGGAEAYATDKANAEEMGFLTKSGNVSVSSYEKAKTMVGDSVPALNFYKDFQAQDFSSMAEKIPYVIDNTDLTDAQKGMLITGKTDPSKLQGKVVTSMYDMGGWEGVYYWYVLKNLADTNGNGSVDKKERNALLNSDNPYVTQLPDDMYYYLGGVNW